MHIKSTKIRNTINNICRFIGEGPVAYPPVPKDNRILFFSRDRDDFRFLSNFFPSPVILDGVTWQTVEHYYQAQKSEDPGYQERVRGARHPGKAKRLGDSRLGNPKISKQSLFRKNPALLRENWDQIKLSVMRRAVSVKFKQHQDLRKMLIATRNAVLLEDSASDFFWGIGANGTGENYLGRLLMEVRSKMS